MKNKKIIHKNRIAVLALSLLTTSSLVMSATYEPSTKNDSSVNQVTGSEGSTNSVSTLELLQRSELEGKKSSYTEVLNFVKQNKIKEAREKVTALIKQTPNEAEFYILQA